MKHSIYLDHNATTPIDSQALEYMVSLYAHEFGNPSSAHQFGLDAAEVLDECRLSVASFIGAERPDEIVFCGGGSEANNHAIIGTYLKRREKGNHIITTAIEHPAVLETCQFLEKHFGARVTYLMPDKPGIISPEKFMDAIAEDTILASVMLANNEVGSIQPIAEMGKACREKGIWFHTDAVQAINKIPVDVTELNVDMLSSSAHKFYGPKGVGFLYIRKGIRPLPLIHGGHQEKSRRAGTHNLPAIGGMTRALQLHVTDMETEAQRLITLRERLWQGIEKSIGYVTRFSPQNRCLPGTLNVCFNFIEGEGILLGLDALGVAASTGSACSSGSLDPSHVLIAMGYPHELTQGSIRFGLGQSNTSEDIDYVLEILPPIVKRLREMSPLWSNGHPVDIKDVMGTEDASCAHDHDHEDD